MAALVFGFGGWTATTEIAGAVVAGGAVAVEGGSRRVQHPEGGVVRKFMVKDGDEVEAGQLLVQLDDVAIRASLEVVLSQLRDAIARQSRLSAESVDGSVMVLPASVANWRLDPELATIMGDQANLRQSRRISLDSQIARFDQLMLQKRSAIVGLKAQLDANERQQALTREEGNNLDELFGKGLVPVQRVNEMKRAVADLEGKAGEVTAAIASAEANISELQMQRSQLTVDFKSEVLSDLQTASQTVAELLQKEIAARDRLAHLEIRAPIAGIVHESIVQTVGGVVTAGDTLMLIVPPEDHLQVDVRVSPLDIDKLHVDQVSAIRMSSFDVRTTPELNGTIKSISPEVTRDPNSGSQYYLVKVDIADAERGKLPEGTRFVPGMPVEAFFEIGNRTVLSYLLAPLTDQLNRTFREG